MAGGIDWFRWHHGSVTDPKFQLIAKKAGVRLGDVMVVWAFILEKASEAGDGGRFGEIDCEAVDVMFDFPDTQTRTADVLMALAQRGLIHWDGQRGGLVDPRRYFPAVTMRPSGGAWSAIRAFIFKRDNFTCRYCQARGVRLECDHVVAVADGGLHTPENLVTACFTCNRKKGSRSVEEFLRDR